MKCPASLPGADTSSMGWGVEQAVAGSRGLGLGLGPGHDPGEGAPQAAPASTFAFSAKRQRNRGLFRSASRLRALGRTEGGKLAVPPAACSHTQLLRGGCAACPPAQTGSTAGQPVPSPSVRPAHLLCMRNAPGGRSRCNESQVHFLLFPST